MAAKITILGRLGKAPEMRYTGSGKAVTNIPVATDRTWLNADGERQKETTWFRIAFWGKSAETINNYFGKGDQIYVEGRLDAKIKVFDTQNGPSAAYEVTAETWEFCGKSSGTGAGASEGEPQPETDDEIPF